MKCTYPMAGLLLCDQPAMEQNDCGHPRCREHMHEALHDRTVEALAHWRRLADDEVVARAHGAALCPQASIAREKTYRATVKALECELRTGVAVCSCCLKPFARGTTI